jgi:ArsR family transcriptional regulator
MRREASIFKALSDETRLQMLGLLLKEGELCVCDVMEVLGITQSKASRHLRHLVDAGLLQDRREAVWVYFTIAADPDPVQARVLETLRAVLPQRVPAELIERLGAWRRRKAKDCTTCAPRRPRAARSAGERAHP